MDYRLLRNSDYLRWTELHLMSMVSTLTICFLLILKFMTTNNPAELLGWGQHVVAYMWLLGHASLWIVSRSKLEAIRKATIIDDDGEGRFYWDNERIKGDKR